MEPDALVYIMPWNNPGELIRFMPLSKADISIVGPEALAFDLECDSRADHIIADRDG